MPAPKDFDGDEQRKAAVERSLNYMGFKGGANLAGDFGWMPALEAEGHQPFSCLQILDLQNNIFTVLKWRTLRKKPCCTNTLVPMMKWILLDTTCDVIDVEGG